MLSLPSKRFYPWNSKRQKQQIFKTNTPRIITSRIVSHLRHLYHNCFFHFMIRQLRPWDLFSVTGSNLLLSSITYWSIRSSDTHPVSPLTADSSATLRMHAARWITFFSCNTLLSSELTDGPLTATSSLLLEWQSKRVMVAFIIFRVRI